MRLPISCILNMRFSEIVAPKTPTAQQSRLDALKTQKDNASKALDSERKRQKVVKAQQNLQKAVSA